MSSRSRALKAAIAPLAEELECRRLLAINPVGAPIVGALSGKIVYASPGHGWQYNSTLARFATDRGDNNEIVEDFGNQDQFTFFADYVLRAGGTFVPMRPVGHQLNEVVLDNDSAGVTFSGAWSNSTSTVYYDEDYGASADSIPYRFASTNATESATATYTPNIPQAGFYPIYTWVRSGTDRIAQLYKINHTGGQTQIKVDHSMVGSGWIYLGTYYFNAGSSAANGSVVISNQGPASKVVIADAIRFGNGMGDVPSGPSGIGTGSISGYPREDENALHWLYRGIGIGGPSSIISIGNVSAPSDMAQYMNSNTNPFGTSVYVGMHSNAGGGRGARGLIDADAAEQTQHQSDLALYLGRQINTDMQGLNGQFEYNWSTGTTHTFTGQFGEINLGGSAEMDATIIEVAFHDSVEDAAIMRDPKGRDQIARSVYEGVLEYFDNYGGLSSPAAVPAAPVNVRAVSNASGQVTLNWSAGPVGVRGGTASGYRIYTSLDGYGFDGGTNVSGGGTTSASISGLNPNVPHYFKIVATNAGGESKASEVLSALPSGGYKRVLIVNGYDRFDRNNDVRYPYAYIADGLVDRVYPRNNNTFDYAVQVASAIQAAKPGMHVASTSNEAVINGSVDLRQYQTVIWILGEESTADDTFNATEQTKVEQFIANGGSLFVTGAEIGWDLDQQNNGRSFYETTLKGNYVADDANTYSVSGIAGSIFAGLSFSFDNGAQFYDTDFADVVTPQAGASAALNYSGGAGNAGIQVARSGGRGALVMFGFPFETITTAANRNAVMGRVLDFFGTGATGSVAGRIYSDYNDNGVQDAGEPGISGASATLDTNQDGLFGANDMIAVTNAAGDFSFTAVPTGTYQMTSSTGTAATLTSIGASSYSVTVTDGGAISGRDFRYFPVVFNGTTGDDSYYVRLDAAGTRIEISIGALPAATPDYSVARTKIDDLTFNLAGGDDLLTVDYSNGNLTTGEVFFNGGVSVAGDLYRVIGTGGDDTLTLSPSSATFSNDTFTSLAHPAAADVEKIQFDAGGGNDTLNHNFTTGPQPVVAFNGASGDNTLNVNGGMYSFANDAADSSDNLAVNVAAGASVVFDATQHLRDLDVDGSATLTQGGGKVLVTRGLAVGGKLNLSDNDLVLDYDPAGPNPFASVQQLIASAYDFGAWDGNGILTNMPDAAGGLTTLGIADPAALFGLGASDTMEFSGQTADGSTVLIKYTYAGDANLDGVIDGGDYGIIDNFVQVPGASGYFNGDFNYDGVIDGGDYGIIDNNIQAQGAPL